MIRVFIAGTDTGVGKTVVSAALLSALSRRGQTSYWKPIQTGTVEDDDTSEVVSLTGLPGHFFHPPTYRFKAPLSPHLAAKLESVEIDSSKLTEAAEKVKKCHGSIIVEGAGGLLVPIAPSFLQIDFIVCLGLPVLLVAHDKLGAINQVLLSLEACRTRGIPVLGVVLNRAGFLEGNDRSIEEYGKTRILGRFQEQPDKKAALRILLQGMQPIINSIDQH